MSTFDTLIKNLLLENRMSFETSTLTEEEREYIDEITSLFVDLYNTYKDQILKTIKAKKKSINLRDGQPTTPTIITLFRTKFDPRLDKITKTHLEKTTANSWDYQLNKDLHRYLLNVFYSYISRIDFFVDPESSDDLCVSIVDANQLSELTMYGANIPIELTTKRKIIYYPEYLEDTIKKAFTACLLFLIRCTMKMSLTPERVPYFQYRSKALRKEIAKRHGDPEIVNLLDF
jgi:hypothetical protein